MSELHQNTESVINLHILIRDKVCREICDGNRFCRNMTCIKAFFDIAGQIENKTDEEHEHKNK